MLERLKERTTRNDLSGSGLASLVAIARALIAAIARLAATNDRAGDECHLAQTSASSGSRKLVRLDASSSDCEREASVDSHDRDLSSVAASSPVQQDVSGDLRPEQEDFERQLQAAGSAVTAMLDRRPGRKPPPNVSIEDRDYIYTVVKGTAKRRNLSSETAEKYTQMLYKAANYLGERGQSLKASDDLVLNELSGSVFKTNKHVGIALRALQEHRGGSSASRRAPDAPDGSIVTGRIPTASTEADRPLIESIIADGIKSKHWASTTVQHHDTILRKLSNSLGTRDMTLAGTSDSALFDYVQEAFPKNWKRMTASLGALREYREANASGASGQGSSAATGLQQPGGEASASPALDVVPEELRHWLDDEADEALITADHPELLRRQQELRQVIGDQQSPLSGSRDPGELNSDPGDFTGRPAKLRRLLMDESTHSPVSASREELQRLHQEIQNRRDDQITNPPIFIDPWEFTFDPKQFPPGELRRLLDDEPISSGADQVTRQLPPAPVHSEEFIFDPEQFPPGELRQLLDDEPAQLEAEPPDSQVVASIDRGDLAFDPEPFPSLEFQRLLRDDPADLEAHDVPRRLPSDS
ncbi:hypothetical protein [Bradyrhizobium sp. USDA 4473]